MGGLDLRPLLDVGKRMQHDGPIPFPRYLHRVDGILRIEFFTGRHLGRPGRFGRAMADGLELTGTEELYCVSRPLYLNESEHPGSTPRAGAANIPLA